MKELLQRYQTQTFIGGFAIAFIWLQLRVVARLPAVMQDEYIYSMQARKIPLAELDFPNYLFSLVYSTTNTCGINYYSCAKNLNLFFFAGFVAIIFFLALHFLGRWWAFGLSLATLLSPLGVYASLFMPESMYFFFALISVVGLWWAARKGLWWQYLIAGSLVGLTALVKPHALFLAAGAVLFILVVHFKSWKRFGIALASYAVGTLGTKLGLGFILAGPAGITLFGSSYTSALTTVADDLSGSGAPEGLNASAPGGNNQLVDFVGQTIFQIGWQSAAVFLLTGGLLAVVLGSLRAAGGQKLDQNQTDAKRFGQVALISLGSMVLFIGVFGAIVTIMGDDHSNRLLLRYYEFLVPVLAIAALAAAKNSGKSNLITWLVAGGTTVIGAVAFWVWFPSLTQLFADSPFMMGVTATEFSGALAVAIALALGVAAFLKSNLRFVVLGSLTIFSLVFFGLSSMNRFVDQTRTVLPFDAAGIFARDYLASADPATIHFVGVNRQFTQASIFWMDKPDVLFTLAQPLSPISPESLPAGTEWVMTMDGAMVDITPRFVISGEGWSLLNISESDKHFFNQAMQDTPIESTTGLGPITNRGQWVEGDVATIRFKEPVPAAAKMTMQVLVGTPGDGQRIEMYLGDGGTYVDMPEAGNLATLDLVFNNTLPAQEIEILLPPGLEDAFSVISLERAN